MTYNSKLNKVTPPTGGSPLQPFDERPWHLVANDHDAQHAVLSQKFCRSCHTPTMSPKFDFAAYSAKGLHARKAAE